MQVHNFQGRHFIRRKKTSGTPISRKVFGKSIKSQKCGFHITFDHFQEFQRQIQGKFGTQLIRGVPHPKNTWRTHADLVWETLGQRSCCKEFLVLLYNPSGWLRWCRACSIGECRASAPPPDLPHVYTPANISHLPANLSDRSNICRVPNICLLTCPTVPFCAAGLQAPTNE